MDGQSKSGPGEVPSTADPVEMALHAERHDPAPDSPARRVLLKHERLIEAQTAQLGRQRWRDFIITALGLCVLALAGLLVWDGWRADGVAVEPFAVPPDLAERGLSGPVMATQLLDKLTGMQAQTESMRASSTYANAWGGDIAVEIPNTGVSIGELRRYLREWLGNQTRLSGEVFRLTDGRIAVVTRVGAEPGTRAEGTEAELDALLQQGAEAIYAQTQPYRWAVWLSRHERVEEAKAQFLALTRAEDEEDRLWGFNGLAIWAADDRESVRFYEAALRLRPNFTPALFNLGVGLSYQGEEEAVRSLYSRLLENRAVAGRDLEPGRADAMLSSADQTLASLKGDMSGAARLSEASIGQRAGALSMAMQPLNAAYSHAVARDLPAMRRVLEEHGLSTPEAMAERLEMLGPELEVDSIFSNALGDFAAERDRLEAVLAAIDGFDRDAAAQDPTVQTRYYLAVAQARSGRAQEARAVIAPTPLTCAPCVRARATVEAYAGNPAAADHWFRQAVRMSPSLPAAHEAWAEAYLVRRDPARAIEQARLAVEKGPKWADPRKRWGDALMMQGRPRDAVRKYQEAARLAPNWGALHLALGRAQAAAGQPEAARESFQRAARLDLNPADRAAVQAALRPR